MKVADEPEHTGLADAEIEIPAGSIGLRVITTGADSAGLPVLQISLELRITLIVSLFVGM